MSGVNATIHPVLFPIGVENFATLEMCSFRSLFSVVAPWRFRRDHNLAGEGGLKFLEADVGVRQGVCPPDSDFVSASSDATKRYKDTLKSSVNNYGIDSENWENIAADRSTWHSQVPLE